MNPSQPLLALSLACLATSASAQSTLSSMQPTRVRDDAKSMCGRDADKQTYLAIKNLADCIAVCPNPGGEDACKPSASGRNKFLNGISQVHADQVACDAYLAPNGASAKAYTDTNGANWGNAKCPNEFGYAARLLFEKAKGDESFYKAAVWTMVKELLSPSSSLEALLPVPS